MRTHKLKVWPAYFDALLDCSKPFEVRKNDRHFETGDCLLLQEWDPTTQVYSGRAVYRIVSYILHGGDQWGAVTPGFVVLGLSPG